MNKVKIAKCDLDASEISLGCMRIAGTADPDYQTLLAMVRAGQTMLNEMTRFNMPNVRPRPAYLREMQRYGILPPDFNLTNQTVNVYDLDRRYWEALWYRPAL